MKTILLLQKSFRFADSDYLLKRILIVTVFFALCSAPFALSQIPQGFTYQAVAFDAAGVPVRNASLPVRISIESDSLGGTLFWQELHSSVTTNATGFFSLVLGSGARQAGTAATFADIDWSLLPKFIRIEIDHGGWKTMGASRLWSVPYAMAAGDLTGSLKKLEVAGEAALNDEALFEVKNKNGQIVFAVYNEGVRVYVGDGENKAVKGGFAIGSMEESKAEPDNLFIVNRDSVRIYLYEDLLGKPVKGGFAIGSMEESKALNQEYMRITRDSIRMYISENTSGKPVKGGFAIGSMEESKGGKSFFDVNTSSEGIINPSENRILWYPLKNAFLTGRVLIDSPVNVGENSFSSGFESRAQGDYSQALGYQAIALGDYSTAIGREAVANEENSFAFGQFAQARNNESYAFGRGAIAEGLRSFAFGSEGVDSAGAVTGVAYAKGDYSFAIGQGSVAEGFGSVALGLADTARGVYAIAMGYKATASGYGSTAMGYGTTASDRYSTAMGLKTTASGRQSTAFGILTTASALSSTAIGNVTTASGIRSTAMGSFTTASGAQSTAMGHETNASGSYSTAMGSYTIAPSGFETVIGRYNTNYTPASTTGWNTNDRLFVIGNGTTDGARSNAVTILKNGNVGIGTASPAEKVHVNGDIVLGPSINNERFIFHSRRNANGDYMNITSDNSSGDWVWSRGIILNRSGNVVIGGGDQTTYKLRVTGTVYASGGYSSSDIKYKRDIEAIQNPLESILSIEGVSYTWDREQYPDWGFESGRHFGVIAQQVEKILPEIVLKSENDELAVSYTEIIPILIEAMKEQQAHIESQKQQIDQLLQQNNQINDELQSLRAGMEELKALILVGNK